MNSAPRSTPPLPPWTAQRIEVRAGGTTLADVTIPAVAVPQEASPLPLLMMSMGRSGSTLMMELLRRHPSIIVAGPKPYEVKLLTYYALSLAMMTGEAHRTLSLDADKMGVVHNRYAIGRNPFNDQAYSRSSAVRKYWEHRAPAVLGPAFRRAVVEYYDAEREAAGRRSFAVFAEKVLPNDFLRDGVRAMFPEARVMLLVRDPRDTLCSYRDFWHEDPAEAERLIDNHLMLLLRLQQQPDVLLTRYEDLIADRTATLARIWQYLGIPAVDLPNVADDSATGHVTSPSVAASIGRWRRDLSEADRTRLNQMWRPALAELRYPPE
jgi:Sulfotransferase family